MLYPQQALQYIHGMNYYDNQVYKLLHLYIFYFYHFYQNTKNINQNINKKFGLFINN